MTRYKKLVELKKTGKFLLFVIPPFHPIQVSSVFKKLEIYSAHFIYNLSSKDFYHRSMICKNHTTVIEFNLAKKLTRPLALQNYSHGLVLSHCTMHRWENTPKRALEAFLADCAK